MTEKRWRIGLLVLLFVLMYANGRTIFLRMKEPVVWDGVFVEHLPLGGLTGEQAFLRLKAYEEELAAYTVTVSYGAVKTEPVSLKSLGFQSDYETILEEIFQWQKHWNPIRNYLEKRRLKKEPKQYRIQTELEETLLQEYLEKQAVFFEVAPVEPVLYRENGIFVYQEGKNGSRLSVALTSLQTKKQLESWNRQENLRVAAVSEKVEPQYSLEWLRQCNTLLAEYSTSYAVTEDVDEEIVKGRIQNIKNGAEKLDGIFLLPGEIFSCCNALAPFTLENGYDTAATYLKGRVIESMGGGVCQLSTTLYNACLFAELEVVERQEHSMTVGYVPLARDAAIAEENKDLKFKNNTDAPVYIEAKAEEGLVTFLIYGKAKKAGREVRLQTVVLETIQPGADVVVKNSFFPENYFQVLQTARTGYKAELYRIVYQNGMEIEREKINTSDYAAAPRYVEVGGRE